MTSNFDCLLWGDINEFSPDFLYLDFIEAFYDCFSRPTQNLLIKLIITATFKDTKIDFGQYEKTLRSAYFWQAGASVLEDRGYYKNHTKQSSSSWWVQSQTSIF